MDHSSGYDFDAVIIGGGLAGLVSACVLADGGKKVLIIEKKTYPFQKVCGEYISNEVLEYLQRIGFDPLQYGASVITRLRVSAPSGKTVHAPLGLGGFGISRYIIDEAMSKLAVSKGAVLWTGEKVMDVTFKDDGFVIQTMGKGDITSKIAIGAYGKRDTLDKKLNREFIKHHTGYMGVKYHVKLDYPHDEIGLDNFENGYCGIVKIEEDKYNICYLYRRTDKVAFKTPAELEEKVLYRNPVLKRIFTGASFVSREPEVINQICFDKKNVVEGHVMMCGDTSGLITPLCGNGMSMAITAAKILGELIIRSGVLNQEKITGEEREKLENSYIKTWNDLFRSRLFWGKTIQRVFGNPTLTGACINTISVIPPLRRWLINATHGKTVV